MCLMWVGDDAPVHSPPSGEGVQRGASNVFVTISPSVLRLLEGTWIPLTNLGMMPYHDLQLGTVAPRVVVLLMILLLLSPLGWWSFVVRCRLLRGLIIPFCLQARVHGHFGDYGFAGVPRCHSVTWTTPTLLSAPVPVQTPTGIMYMMPVPVSCDQVTSTASVVSDVRIGCGGRARTSQVPARLTPVMTTVPLTGQYRLRPCRFVGRTSRRSPSVGLPALLDDQA